MTGVTFPRPPPPDLCGVKRWLVHTAFIALGALAGYLWWFWYGCTEGCAITSIWWRSTAYGAVLGYLAVGMVLPGKMTPKTRDDDRGEG